MLHQRGQSHVFRFYDSLTESEQTRLLQSLRSVNIDEALDAFNASGSAGNVDSLSPAQAESFSAEAGASDTLFHSGINHIAHGHAAVVILAGGQGTRLGHPGPKGEVDVGLPSHKSLFQLHCEKVKRLLQLASRKQKSASLPVYVMTSPAVHEQTYAFLSRNYFFGLPEEDVILFQQAETPCLDFEGNLMLHSRCELAKAPNGNGGMFEALYRSGALADMHSRKTLAVHICSIDNVLAPTADPELIAHLINNSMQACAKVTPKSKADESVGVFARNASGALCVVEYSELPEHRAHARDESSGELCFNAANIAMHAFSVGFLQHCANNAAVCKLHLAKKKVPYVSDDGSTTIQPDNKNAYKLESFIFDAFPHAHHGSLVQTTRAEFAPVKNANGTII